MNIRALLLFLIGASTAACFPGYKVALHDASQAERAGDLRAALRYYEKACDRRYQWDFSAPPTDERRHRTCKKVKEVRAQLATQLLVAARTPCAAGQTAKCAEIVREAEAVRADGELTRALLDKAGSVHAKRCVPAAEQPNDLIRHVRCLQIGASDIRTKRYQRHVARVEKSVAGRFATLADDAAMQRTPGARAQLLAIAAHYDKDKRPLSTEAWKSFQRERHATVDLRLRTDYTNITQNELCAALRGTVGDAIECKTRGSIAIRAKLEVLPARYSRSVRQRSKQYQSGTRSLPNPALPGAQRSVLHAQRALEQIELTAAVEKAECERATAAHWAGLSTEHAGDLEAEKKAACTRHESIQAICSRRQDELYAAKRDLRNTSEYLTQPLYSSHEWTETTHLWTRAYRYEVDGAKHSAVATYESLQRPGFAPANVSSQSMRNPTPTDFSRTIQRQIASAIARQVKTTLAERAEKRRSACNHAAPQWKADWLQCRAETALLEKGRLDVVRLLAGVPEAG